MTTIIAGVTMNTSYDRDADVLYLYAGDQPQPAAYSRETPEGHVLRYSDTDELVGVTVIAAKEALRRDGAITFAVPVTVADAVLA